MSKAYAEISSGRMKKVRGQVLYNRDFLAGIDRIFADVRKSYKGKKLTFLAHNGKTVAVLISANTGLYGDLVPQVFRSFLTEIRKSDVEAAIVGKLGLSLFLSEEPKRPYTYFDFPDYGTDAEKLASLIAHLVPYEEIRIYHGKFENLIIQKPSVFDISAETPLANAPQASVGKTVKYLFEPEVEEILGFFESEMFTSLVEQVLNESQLAKFASRMLAMDRAYQNIEKDLAKTRIDLLRSTHHINNKKQLESVKGMRLWAR